MFNVHLNADDIDRLAMVIGLVLLFLYGARARLRFDRIRLRFSLRALLIAMTIVAVLLGIAVTR